MPSSVPLDPRDFYKKFPSAGHEAGDIWSNIPIGYMFKREFERAIVITPSCDLAQSKTEMVNFIPIISIERYVHSKPFFKEVSDYISNQINGYFQSNLISTSRFENIKEQDIIAAIELIRDDKKGSDLRHKLTEYIKYINYTGSLSGCNDKQKPNISTIMTDKNYCNILKRIVTNSYKGDVHFLPHDGQVPDYSAVQSHSLAMFRYSFSIPIEILDLANKSTGKNWQDEISILQGTTPMAKRFTSYPIKLSTLKDDFLSDMLSRYIGMHMRLGSRDFTEETVNHFVAEVRK